MQTYVSIARSIIDARNYLVRITKNNHKCSGPKAKTLAKYALVPRPRIHAADAPATTRFERQDSFKNCLARETQD